MLLYKQLGVDYMEIIVVLIIITLVFSVTIGLIIMNRDDVPDVLVEEINEALEDKRKDFEKENLINDKILQENIEVSISLVDDDEII